MPKCTYCGSSKFFTGPSGGMSTNILCANEKCRHWFNFTPGIGEDGLLDDLHKVEPTETERNQQELDKRAQADAERQIRHTEGAQAYLDGKHPGTLRDHRWTYPQQQDIDRLCGFMHHLAEQVRDLTAQVQALKS